MIDAFVAGPRLYRCTVVGPYSVATCASWTIERVRPGRVQSRRADPRPRLRVCAAAGATCSWPTTRCGPIASASAAVGITGSALAVAEPSTFVFLAAPGSPWATNLVPPAHVCVVRVADVVATLTDVLARMAEADLPSVLTWVGGPSRTGDLEMILTLGVHGPRTVDVILVD